MKFGSNAIEILKRRYLLRDSKGKIIENPDKMLKRVAKNVAKGNAKLEKEFYSAMSNLEFLPNSPTLMNAGTKLGQLSACFVLPVEDSLESIFDTLKLSALIHQTGGGTGFSFSRIRPKGDVVGSTKGIASGPVSFMKIYDKSTEVVKQGGKRRGANMGILNVDHPDIIEFIRAKENEKAFRNFNLSVGITDKFMKAVKAGKKYDLINPKTKKSAGKADARKIFDLIIEMAWKTGDPGIVFLDEINRKHPLERLGKIESTNPCGEVPLLPYESCNLGSINLSKLVSNGKIDYSRLGKIVRTAVQFLDNVIDINKYPLPEIEKITKANRKIGLGVMGFAEMLILIGIRYDSNEALKVADKIMEFVSSEARKISAELGKKKGNFSNFKKSIWYGKYKSMRNATVTTIAPTGTISILTDCSNGIEPLFAVKFTRTIYEGKKLVQINSLFGKIKKKELFVTAHNIKPEWHIKMQAVFQKYVDNAVSKTVNLRKGASKNDVRKIFLMAYDLKCKGVTVYREGSKKEQLLSLGKCKVCV
ncbi:adenosylcobalamin-dependent ribonucleoside-diphosphate reductase [Candidatus Woesearchaeota archaeon]|nr:adenosylcobalamin-dependent ribonucleoside-diphosphate reductase [Candidatus Woesearchaeota archaeon]